MNVRDRKGLTPLQHALRGPRNRECAVILLESGAQFDVDIFETDYGTLLHEMYVSDDTAHLLRLTELMLATGPEDLATAVTCNDGDTLLNKLLKFFGSARPRDRDEYVDEVCPSLDLIILSLASLGSVTPAEATEGSITPHFFLKNLATFF